MYIYVNGQNHYVADKDGMVQLVREQTNDELANLVESYTNVDNVIANNFEYVKEKFEDSFDNYESDCEQYRNVILDSADFISDIVNILKDGKRMNKQAVIKDLESLVKLLHSEV